MIAFPFSRYKRYYLSESDSTTVRPPRSGTFKFTMPVKLNQSALTCQWVLTYLRCFVLILLASHGGTRGNNERIQMFNATIIGNVAAKAELKYLKDKRPVVNFRIASNAWKGGNEVTTWVNVSFFGLRAEKIAGYLDKGKLVAISGGVYNRPYEAKDGTTHYSLDVDADNVQLLGGNNAETKSTTSDMVGSANYSPTDAPF